MRLRRRRPAPHRPVAAVAAVAPAVAAREAHYRPGTTSKANDEANDEANEANEAMRTANGRGARAGPVGEGCSTRLERMESLSDWVVVHARGPHHGAHAMRPCAHHGAHVRLCRKCNRLRTCAGTRHLSEFAVVLVGCSEVACGSRPPPVRAHVGPAPPGAVTTLAAAALYA